MKYVLLFVETEQFTSDMEAMSPAERERAYNRVNEWFANHADKMRGGSKLKSPETATTVRLDRGEPVITDGPFVEGKEVVSGYAEIEADDLDQVLHGPQDLARLPARRDPADRSRVACGRCGRATESARVVRPSTPAGWPRR